MTMLLAMLSEPTKADIERAQSTTSAKLIDGNRLTEAGVEWLTQRSEVKGIQSPADLMALARELGVRADWHEPDEQYVDARIIGTHLDNAMGSTMRTLPQGDPDNPHGELNVVLSQHGQDRAVVNLATLLSWACGYERQT